MLIMLHSTSSPNSVERTDKVMRVEESVRLPLAKVGFIYRYCYIYSSSWYSLQPKESKSKA